MIDRYTEIMYNIAKEHNMPWIENVSLADIPKGRHHNAGENSMLIQIVDPDMEFPQPTHKFKETHQFKFLDIEANDFTIDETFR